RHTSPLVHHVTCSRIRLPAPISPLFPYTTLFRSDDSALRQGHGMRIEIVAGSRREACDRADRSQQPERRAEVGGHHPLGDEQEEDRKSTRLNSSHVSISYAVFCLKKKNKRQIPHK